MKNFFAIFLLSICAFTNPERLTSTLSKGEGAVQKRKISSSLYLIVLGTAQDAGYPQAGCMRACCANYYSGKTKKQNVASLALVDKSSNKIFIFDCTPDFKEQWHTLQTQEGMTSPKKYPDAIFLTHAHIGHYTGLMQLGREVMGADNVPVYAMPRMSDYLSHNGPWSQLVSLKNISLNVMKEDSAVQLSNEVKVIPILVPHRDEFSETVGFRIETDQKKILFIPDIDKWEKWNRSIIDEIKKVDVAFIDGTFYKDGELSGRTMKDVPHPFVEESMKLFSTLPPKEKHKIFFIHFNHTNPLLWDEKQQQQVREAGFDFAMEGMRIEM